MSASTPNSTNIPIKVHPHLIPLMEHDPTINPTTHTLADPENLQLTRPTMNDLLITLADPATTALQHVVTRRWAILESARNQILTQLTADAFRKTRHSASLAHFRDAIQHIDGLVSTELRGVRTMDLDAVDGLPGVPEQVIIAVIQRLGERVGEIEARNKLNLAIVNDLVQREAEGLCRRLVQVAMWQFGGSEGFVRMLEGNAHELMLYETEGVREVVGVAKLLVGAMVEGLGREVVNVTMHVGDWRLL